MSINALLIEVISMIIAEEHVGTKGKVRYYQMGASLPDALYNTDLEGRPTRDPGVPGLKHRHRRKKSKRKSK